MTPKVKFKVAGIEDIIPSMNYFLNNIKHPDWGNSILSVHPKLKKDLENIKGGIKRKKLIQNYFGNFLNSNKKELKNSEYKFQSEWDKINSKFMPALSEVLEIDWSKKDKFITALVSPNPLCPRYIKERIYEIYFDSRLESMKTTCFHEILHFLYFEKWKQVFPKTKEREFDGPEMVWQLSEMVPKAILSDKRIQRIYEHNPPVYAEYREKKINGKSLLKSLDEFYNKRKDFEDFLKKSWIFVNKYKKEIGRI